MDRNTIRPHVGARTQPHVAPVVNTAAQSNSNRRKRSPSLRGVVTIIAVVAIALLIMWLLRGTLQEQPDRGKYQAVFLQTGAVYFGKLKNVDGTYLQLERAYYTKKQDLPSDATDEQKAAVANNVSLVKVGDEVYGPESTMSIRSEQVLFWQNLKSDSKVSKAIDSAK